MAPQTKVAANVFASWMNILAMIKINTMVKYHAPMALGKNFSCILHPMHTQTHTHRHQKGKIVVDNMEFFSTGTV